MSKSHYSAMDLHVARGGSSSSNNNSTNVSAGDSSRSSNSSSSNASRKADDSGLSARNVLIRRKLMERKRFDSADHAMRQQQQEQQQQSKCSSVQQGFSPAQIGASVLFSALGGDENVDMEAAASGPAPAATTAAGAAATTTTPAPLASRYGGLSGPAGGAASARNILIQKKLREKKHFDSADYQLAQLRPGASPSAGDDSGASPMEIDLSPVADPAAAAATINSPSAASIAGRGRVDAQMSPSVRGGRYGGISGANVLLTRKLSEKKRFDSADYQMQAGPAAAAARASGGGRQQQQSQHGYGQRGGTTTSFFVPAAGSSSSVPAPPPGPASAAIPAPVAATAASQAAAGGSKYGKLSAANVLIRKKLKERKRFDSADYAMEKQGQEEPASAHQGGSAGALRGGHVVAGTPSTVQTSHATNPDDVSAAPEESKSINHQVKHIKLSEAAGGWASRVPAAAAASGVATAKLGAGAYGSLSQDSRLAARNLIIQRKLSERKRFDSADYFKEAAARGHSA